MIVVDTSAFVAIAFGEPERDLYLDVIERSDAALISTASVLEARMFIDGRRGQRAVILADDMLRLRPFEMVAPGPAEIDTAYAAFVTFGKASGHPAGLNFGDLFGYALAKTRGLQMAAMPSSCSIDMFAIATTRRAGVVNMPTAPICPQSASQAV